MRKAADLVPDFVEPAYHLARLLVDAGITSDALDVAQQLQALRPHNPGILALMGSMLYMHNQDSLARLLYDRVQKMAHETQRTVFEAHIAPEFHATGWLKLGAGYAVAQLCIGTDEILRRRDGLHKLLSSARLSSLSPPTFDLRDGWEPFEQALAADPQQIWVLKPGGGRFGRGLTLVSHAAAQAAQPPSRMTVLPLQRARAQLRGESWLAQQHLSDPLLIDDRRIEIRALHKSPSAVRCRPKPS
jgi:hypothetical protein